MNDKIHFDEFAEQVALETGYDLESAKAYIYALFETIIEENERGEMVKIRNFGSFKPVFNKARRTINPQTGTPMTVPAHYHIHFAPSQTLSTIVNAPFSHLHATKISEVKSNTLLYAIVAGVLLLAGIAAYLILGGDGEKHQPNEAVVTEAPMVTEEPAIEAVPEAPAEEAPMEQEKPALAQEVKEPVVELETQAVPKESEAAPKQNYGGGEYRVNQRDTLYNISEILYSDANFWPAIFSKNEEDIHDPDLIYPNTPLKIPARPDIVDPDELTELERSYVSAYKRYKSIGKQDKAMWLLYTGCVKYDKKLIENSAIDPEDRKSVKALLKRFDP